MLPAPRPDRNPPELEGWQTNVRLHGGQGLFGSATGDDVHVNDRLLLGLKGAMSKVELHLIRARLNGRRRTKAAAGWVAAGVAESARQPRRTTIA